MFLDDPAFSIFSFFVIYTDNSKPFIWEGAGGMGEGGVEVLAVNVVGQPFPIVN